MSFWNGSSSLARLVRIRRTLALLLVMLVAFPVGALAALPPGGTFTDDDGTVYEGSIEAIFAAGITKGCNPPANTRFCTNDQVTRGEMAAFLVRALGLPTVGGNTFTDDNGSVFEPNIESLTASEITLGCNPPANSRFCPNDSVTRGQMAAFLTRAYGYSSTGGGDLFSDDDTSVFEDDIDKLATAGITIGCNPPANDSYCPNNPVTRGEMAIFLTRAEGLTPIVPPPAGFRCDAVVPTGTDEINGSSNYSSIGPGDTLCLAAGTRDGFDIVDLHGTAANPITIVNTGGVVLIDGSGQYSGMDFFDSDHIRISGEGVSSVCGANYSASAQACGIRVVGSDRGLTAHNRSEYIEADHIEMGYIGGQAVSMKDDSLNRGEWILRGATLRDSYLHDIEDEGAYIGSSDYATSQDHLVQGVSLHHNLVVNTGRDGLQVGSATADCNIHHNVIRLVGQNNESDHRAGVMNNKGSVCNIYANTVVDAAGWGIYVQGNGTNKIYNNVVIRSGRFVNAGSADGEGIAIHDGSNVSQSIYVWNNTVVSARGDGIGFSNDVGSDNQIINNIVVASQGSNIGGNADVVSNNITGSSASAGFVNAGSNDYRLSGSSSAVDAGADLRSRGVGVDRSGVSRPRGAGFDIGAYESH